MPRLIKAGKETMLQKAGKPVPLSPFPETTRKTSPLSFFFLSARRGPRCTSRVSFSFPLFTVPALSQLLSPLPLLVGPSYSRKVKMKSRYDLRSGEHAGGPSLLDRGVREKGEKGRVMRRFPSFLLLATDDADRGPLLPHSIGKY